MTVSIPQEEIQGTSAPTPKKARVAKRRPHAARAKAKRPGKAAHAKKAASARVGTKTAKILTLLKRPGGVTLKGLMKATDWQAHSVRGFLSGTLGKNMGTPVESFKSDAGERAYRLSSK
ncbi:MAG: hypothetical protein JWO19_4045 [Bryobacterales bacterium]|nr:hypothetical protein [Bryobacterales bacterium]